MTEKNTLKHELESRNKKTNFNDLAKFSFYYLMSFLGLLFSAISVALILFVIVDKSLGDLYGGLFSGSHMSYDAKLQFAISTLFISAPLYYFFLYLINLSLSRKEMSPNLALRRWASYFILLISLLFSLGSLVALLHSFLAGFLNLLNALKILSIFLLSSLSLAYYLYDIRKKDFSRKDRVLKFFKLASLLIIILSFISAFFFITPPKLAKAKRADLDLLTRINNLEMGINNYYNKYGFLPEDHKALKEDESSYYYLGLKNELNGENLIDYQKNSDTDFSLCANFLLDSQELEGLDNYYNLRPEPAHQSGYNCLPGQLYSLKEVNFPQEIN